MPPPIRPPQFGQRGSPQGGIYDDADFLQDEGWPGTSTPNVGGIPEPLPGPEVPFPADRQVAGPEMGEMSGPSGLSDEWTQGLQQTPLAGPVMGEGLQALPPGVSMDEWAPLDDPGKNALWNAYYGEDYDPDADIRGELGPVSPYPPGGGYEPAPTGMLPPPRPPQEWPSDIYPDYSPGPRKPPSRHPENVRPVFEVDYVPGYGPAPGPPGPPSPPWMPEGAAPPPRPEPPPPPGPPRPRGPRIDWMPGDPGYNPDEGRGLRPPGDTGRGLQWDTDRERMLSDIAERGLDRGQSDQLLPIDQTVTARPDLRQLMPLDRPDLAGWAPAGEAPPPWVPPGWSPQGRQAEEERRRTEVPPERRLFGRQRRRIGDY